MHIFYSQKVKKVFLGCSLSINTLNLGVFVQRRVQKGPTMQREDKEEPEFVLSLLPNPPPRRRSHGIVFAPYARKKNVQRTTSAIISEKEFEDILSMGVVPTKWRKNESFLAMLYSYVLQRPQQNANKCKFVMMVDHSNCSGRRERNRKGECEDDVDGAILFQCSMCSYVMDRYYHACKHFQRVHVMNGNPMHRKRKYDFDVDQKDLPVADSPFFNGEKKPIIRTKNRTVPITSYLPSKKKKFLPGREDEKEELEKEKNNEDDEQQGHPAPSLASSSLCTKRNRGGVNKRGGRLAFLGSLLDGAQQWNEIGARLFSNAKRGTMSSGGGFHMRVVDKIEGMPEQMVVATEARKQEQKQKEQEQQMQQLMMMMQEPPASHHEKTATEKMVVEEDPFKYNGEEGDDDGWNNATTMVENEEWEFQVGGEYCGEEGVEGYNYYDLLLGE